MSQNNISVGQDSFLDIIANLVGVLIILVVVVGAQAKSAWQTQTQKAQVETIDAPDIEAHAQLVEQLTQQIRSSSDVATKLKADNEDLELQIREQEILAAQKAEIRHALLLRTEMIKREIDQRRSELDEKGQEIASLQNQRAALAFELSEIEKETAAIQVSFSQPEIETIDHYPNPIAETVFSKEVHFRLADGKISYVPMDELIERMKSEWKFKAEKLMHSNATLETVGPIGNFRMQYELEANDLPTSRNSSPSPGQRSVRFKRFVLHPVNRSAGETVGDALSGQTQNSQWNSILRGYEPASTTVSIWVYPDSFSEHAEIKNWLHEKGFKMASWPLSPGKQISGGPEGFRTSAQ
jgi:hypothetical protein